MPEDPLGWFNAFEALAWFGYGIALFVTAARSERYRRVALVGGVAFVAFGGSDLVEIRTGTWFSPWWLLLWKVSCVVTLTACYLRYRRVKAAADAVA